MVETTRQQPMGILIGLDIDPKFGAISEFVAMTRMAADFRLAEMGYEEYPGLYHMVEIHPDDWATL
jgi:hypothetical protein